MSVVSIVGKEFQVLRVYNAMLIGYGKTKRTKKATVANLKPLRDFVGWCEENGVPPVEFAEACIQQVYDDTERFPALSRLKSKRLLEDDQWRDYGARRKQIKDDDRISRASVAAQGERTRHLDIYALPHASEKIKSYYAGGTQRVCATRLHHHGGWHPRSTWCSQCPTDTTAVCARKVAQTYGIGVYNARIQVTEDQVERF